MAIPKKGTKRPAAASVGARKKSKAAASQAGQCKVITKALADNPMLASVVNKTIGVYSEERHEFQSKFVEMIGEALAASKVSLEEAVTTAKAAVDGAEAEKAKREQAVADADADVKAKEEALTLAEATFATSSETLDGNSTALKEAEKAKKTGEAELTDATKQKAEIEETQLKFSQMKEAAGAPADVKAVKKVMDQLSESSQAFSSEALDYIPTTLKKEPALRSQFDAIIMKTIEDALGEKLTELTQFLSTAATDVEARGAAVESAKATHTSASEKQTEDKAAKDAAVAALKEAKSGLKEAKAAIASYESDMKSASKDLLSAESKLSNFSDGPLAVFTELKDKVRPPPEPVKKPKGSQYKTIGGIRYEKDLLEMAGDEAITMEKAAELWDAAMDGNVVTPTEKRTLRYILKSKGFVDEAKNFLETKMGSSWYQTIDGVQYERGLLQLAADEAKPCGMEAAEKLWKAAQDGTGITPCEKRTLKYILDKNEFEADAKAMLEESMSTLAEIPE